MFVAYDGTAGGDWSLFVNYEEFDTGATGTHEFDLTGNREEVQTMKIALRPE